MPWVHLFRRNPWTSVGSALIAASGFLLLQSWQIGAEPLSIVGARGWGVTPARSSKGPRLSVFETDAWRHTLKTGALEPVAQLPLPRSLGKETDLLRGTRFTPDAYLSQIDAFHETYSQQRDILMYYGGIRRRPNPNGLNFNAWSGDALKKLRALGCRPFIGLESMDPEAIRSMAWRLKEAGYGPLQRIYVRIGAEPSYGPYGTETGTASGKRHTPAAYAAYQKNFARTADYINTLNRQLGLNIHTVFAGTSQADFNRYAPPEYLFDAIGYDLYITPENKSVVLQQIRDLARRYPNKPLVLPEFGIATQGPARTWRTPRTGRASPQWAADALGDVLTTLGRHPGGVEEITVFSVNVSGRRKDRRWNWAWTPAMYEMLKEWQANPRAWRQEGFHSYNPLSYPVGKDVLFLNRPDLRIVYRKLASFKAPGIPLFEEICLVLRKDRWIPQRRTIYFKEGSTYLY